MHLHSLGRASSSWPKKFISWLYLKRLLNIFTTFLSKALSNLWTHLNFTFLFPSTILSKRLGFDRKGKMEWKVYKGIHIYVYIYIHIHTLLKRIFNLCSMQISYLLSVTPVCMCAWTEGRIIPVPLPHLCFHWEEVLLPISMGCLGSWQT